MLGLFARGLGASMKGGGATCRTSRDFRSSCEGGNKIATFPSHHTLSALKRLDSNASARELAAAREAAYMCVSHELQTTTVRRSWCTAAYRYPCGGHTEGGGEMRRTGLFALPAGEGGEGMCRWFCTPC